MNLYRVSMERRSNGRDIFWDNLNECPSYFDGYERLTVLDDLNFIKTN